MRKMKSFVTLVSTVAVMACQTTVASSSLVRQTPVPAVGGAPTASQPTSSQAVTASTRTNASIAAAEGSSRKTWIIIGIIVAVAVAVIVIAGAGGSDSIY